MCGAGSSHLFTYKEAEMQTKLARIVYDIWHLPLHHLLPLEEVTLSLFATRTEEVASSTCVCARKGN